MDKYVSFDQPTRLKRRVHGLQLPLHGQQVLGWIVLLVTFVINMHLLVRVQYRELEITSEIVYVVLYLSHAVSQLCALLLDPGEDELRRQTVDEVPEFDRRLHAHVIENGRCHLCNIFTTSKRTKHCSLCNKCVNGFDHHCRWLNNCVGKRNYLSFISSVVTALLISVFTLVLCVVDIIFYAKYPSKLSAYTQEYVSCIYASIPRDSNETCSNSIAFITLITIYMTCAFCIMCALFHLCIFHVYIGIQGVSTYEYIVNQAADREPHLQCPNNKLYHKPRNIIYWRRIKDNKISPENNFREIEQQRIDHVDYNFSNLVTSIINNELEQARKIFTVDKLKVYPRRRDSDYTDT